MPIRLVVLAMGFRVGEPDHTRKAREPRHDYQAPKSIYQINPCQVTLQQNGRKCHQKPVTDLNIL
jgi:hypothetical protein